MNYFVKLNKKLEMVSGELESLRLTLTVVETSGVTAAIFVHQYFPKSPYSGVEEYEFYNVAYPDELTNISDKLGNQRRACYIRTPKVVKIFKNINELDDFMDTVTSDLSRLLRHLNTFDAVADSTQAQLLVTGDGITETAPEVLTEPVVITDAANVVTSIDSELNNIKTETIIVDITGK